MRHSARLFAAGLLGLCLAGGARAQEQGPVDTGVRPWQAIVVITYLAALAGGGAGLVYYMRRRGLGSAGDGKLIQVVEMRRVAPQLTLVLIEVQGRRMIVALGSSGVSIQGMPADVS